MELRLLIRLTVLVAASVSRVSASAVPQKYERPMAIVHAVVIDGNGGTPIEDGVVVIRGTRIVAVGPAGKVEVPTGSKIIDAGGKTVMPGLADMHVHLVGGWDGYTTDMLGFPRYMNALLYAGVTTVMDTGNVQPYVLQLRQEIAAGRLTGPRIYCAGALIDGPRPLWPPISFAVTSVGQIPSIVKQQKAAGVDIIKAYVGLTGEMVEALCREADKVNLPVFIDQGFRNGSVDLVQRGITAFAHLPTMPVTDSMIVEYKIKPIRFISTLAVYESLTRRRLTDLEFIKYGIFQDTQPAWFIDDLRKEAKRNLSPIEERQKTSWVNRLTVAEANAKKLLDAGILLAAGTDAPYPGDAQGEGLHRELELLVEAGYTPLQAITAATKNAALLVNAQAEWGTLERDKRADLLIVDGRPDKRIGDTRRISTVIQMGRLVDRKRLRFDPRLDPGYRVGGLSSSGN